MTAYLVKDVGPPREFRWEKSKTLMYGFPLKLSAVDEWVEYRQPKDRTWPQVGDRVFGEIKKGPHGPYLKRGGKK